MVNIPPIYGDLGMVYCCFTHSRFFVHKNGHKMDISPKKVPAIPVGKLDSGLAVLPGVHLLDLRMEPFCSLEKRVSWSSPILEVRCVRNIHVIDTPMILCKINFWMFLVLSPILMALGCGLQPTPTSAGGKHSNASSKASTTASTRGAASRVM